MKRIIILLTSLLLFFSLGIVCFAQDEETPEIEEVTATSTETVQKEANSAPQNAEEGKSLSEYFNTMILPLLTSWGASAISFIALLVPFIRKNGKYNQLKGLYSSLMKEFSDLKDKYKDLSPESFTENCLPLITAAVRDTVIKELKLDPAAHANVISKLDLLTAKTESLVRGATNAWAQSPAAVACLASSPTESVVIKQAAYIKSLEDKIREIKGEEAEATLNKLKEA